MIVCEAVVKRYPKMGNGKPVLDGLSFQARDGEFLSIFGRSGSGKSTLLNLVGGLDRRYQGDIRIDGRNLSTLSDTQISVLRGAMIGFVFQTPTFLNHLICSRNLSLAAQFAGFRPDKDMLRSLLDRVGLSGMEQRKPDTLSGGQQQRLALARALVAKPKLLLCDEPTGNLDEETGEQIIDLLSEFNRDGATLIVATHDRRLAKRCGRQLLLEGGKLHEEAP